MKQNQQCANDYNEPAEFPRTIVELSLLPGLLEQNYTDNITAINILLALVWYHYDYVCYTGVHAIVGPPILLCMYGYWECVLPSLTRVNSTSMLRVDLTDFHNGA